MIGNRVYKIPAEDRLVKKVRKMIPAGVRFDQFQVTGIRYNMGVIQARFSESEGKWHTAHDMNGYKDTDGNVIR